MITHMHLIRKDLKDRFPNADVDWNSADACWEVTYNDGQVSYTDRYVVKDGELSKLKLILVGTK